MSECGDTRALIARNAARLRELNDRIREAYSRHPGSFAHREACKVFHEQYDKLAFPGGLERALLRLKALDAETVDTAIEFLDVDPRFFRSGYIKETILRRLKKAKLSEWQRQRLSGLVIRSLQGGGRREFRAYARLAGVLRTATIMQAAQKETSSRNPEFRRRAEYVLHVVASRRAERGEPIASPKPCV